MDQLKLLIFITKRQSHDSLDVKKESLKYVVLLQCGGIWRYTSSHKLRPGNSNGEGPPSGAIAAAAAAAAVQLNEKEHTG